MKLSIDPGLRAKCPRLMLAILEAGVETSRASEALERELCDCEERIRKLPDPKSLLESVEVSATRTAYKALGKDPARYRGSAEALLRRIAAGKPLPRVNNVVDAINIISVESRIPIGLYQRSHLSGDIVFRRGAAGESYKGIGRYDLNLAGLPVFADDRGPHGSPTSDSERTMVTEATSEVVAILISFGGRVAAGHHLEDWAGRLGRLLQQHAKAHNLHVTMEPSVGS